jgi:predicted phosphodiesterase
MLRALLQTFRARHSAIATSSILLATAGTAWSFGSTQQRATAGGVSPPGASIVRLDGRQSFQPTRLRSYKTHVDLYYRKHGELPYPSVPHANLSNEQLEDSREDGQGILIVGDVHGCYDELMELHQKAIQANDGKVFRFVILVGDLCNKGPKSLEVLQHCRTTASWFAVRGNHDNAALAASLGNEDKRQKPKYDWVQDLSDEDIKWMSELPYTLRISNDLTGTEEAILVVHAGFIPQVALEDQSVKTMTTVRTVKRPNDSSGLPWASLWKGDERVVFGHDARLGLQQYAKATGLDTGCVYGNKLTGLLLPQNQLVSVRAKEEYCSVKRND